MDISLFAYVVGTAVALFGFLGGALAFWNNLTAKITTNRNTAETAKANADHANARIDTLIAEFSAQREITARNIGKLEATNDALADAIRDMTASMRAVVQRLDRVVERLPTGPEHQS